mmetsp:Transcript_17606/g.24828  ORF Transcript_17606/g.24828 Transcript_17606/m.24828 type:complete len:229 (-) Transcript_17606:126-812(-)|eukprot:CAMPEP_0184856506 /NCGR_PEP_ID=MMETSP0580-20130426/1696_1 /TAXON_ID=1118495 /ORGANISM="Dactyliosolen fragilissimus" /LENGTH=228 /DNA_ID=CAMNT_0027351583 /DNA_START=101 /DNA_END=787 /DNA_ORIENTATION=+
MIRKTISILFLCCTTQYDLVTAFSHSNALCFKSASFLPSSCTSLRSTAEASPRTVAQSTSKQTEYGKTLELPETYVRCGKCQSAFPITPDDLGEGKGRRVECSVCSHSWFQSRDRLFTLSEGMEMIPLPEHDATRIANNLKEGRDANFMGAAKFYVGNLDFGVQEEDLREVFAAVGEVGDVSIVTSPDGRSKGFAFVTMMEKEDADAAMGLDGTSVKGRNINVKPPNN